jgi:hypothetical protein
MKILKNPFLLFIFLLIFSKAGAQSPQGINYQGIARSIDGTPLSNRTLGIRMSILNNSPNGTIIYSETATVISGANGLFNTVIGTGTPVTGTFSTIDWSTAIKWLQVELDTAGGSNYTLMGSQQLMSVPYSLYATTAKDVTPVTYSIGQYAQGGIVFYVDSTGHHGLVANLLDQGSRNWYQAMSVGKSISLTGGQYFDWRLPSNDELALMLQNVAAAGLGNFVNSFYWSSTEISATTADRQSFTSGQPVGPSTGFSGSGFTKTNSHRARVVRSF